MAEPASMTPSGMSIEVERARVHLRSALKLIEKSGASLDQDPDFRRFLLHSLHVGVIRQLDLLEVAING